MYQFGLDLRRFLLSKGLEILGSGLLFEVLGLVWTPSEIFVLVFIER